MAGSVGRLPILKALGSSLLELAAENDIDQFRDSVEIDGSDIEEIDSWYCRQSGGGGLMVMVDRCPLLIAALYGSVDVLKYILSSAACSSPDYINQRCGADLTTALHCAAAGGSPRAAEVVSILIRHNAAKDITDAYGKRPGDVISVSPKLPHVKSALERLLKAGMASGGGCPADASMFSPPFVSLPTPPGLSPDGSSPLSSSPPSSPKPSSPSSSSGHESSGSSSGGSREREYPMDATLPDIKNSIYTTDDFRMYSFKVRPCSRAYSHDWTECPFVHPGENARRRDPRRFHYSCVPCPDFRKGSCKRGDSCEYAHGVFECWLHPAQYRTRLCKDGTGCARRVCFFAHTADELRPLCAATGAALNSPSSADMLSLPLSNDLPPPSPSSTLLMSQFSTPSTSPSNGPVSPSPPIAPLMHQPPSPKPQIAWNQSMNSLDTSNGMLSPHAHNMYSMGNSHMNPLLNLGLSRIQAALQARDFAALQEAEALLSLSQLKQQQHQQQGYLNDMSSDIFLSDFARFSAAASAASGGSGKSNGVSATVAACATPGRPPFRPVSLRIPTSTQNGDDCVPVHEGMAGGMMAAMLSPGMRRGPSAGGQDFLLHHNQQQQHQQQVFHHSQQHFVEQPSPMSNCGNGFNALASPLSSRLMTRGGLRKWGVGGAGDREEELNPGLEPTLKEMVQQYTDWGCPSGKPDWGGVVTPMGERGRFRRGGMEPVGESDSEEGMGPGWTEFSAHDSDDLPSPVGERVLGQELTAAILAASMHNDREGGLLSGAELVELA